VTDAEKGMLARSVRLSFGPLGLVGFLVFGRLKKKCKPAFPCCGEFFEAGAFSTIWSI
jgi:hypothetical protein